MTRFTTQDKKHIAVYQKQVAREDDYFGSQGSILGYRCKICRRIFPLDIMEVDHIHPQRLGGTDRPDNLRLLCPKCNKVKGGKVQRTSSKSKAHSLDKRTVKKTNGKNKASKIRKATSKGGNKKVKKAVRTKKAKRIGKSK